MKGNGIEEKYWKLRAGGGRLEDHRNAKDEEEWGWKTAVAAAAAPWPYFSSAVFFIFN